MSKDKGNNEKKPPDVETFGTTGRPPTPPELPILPNPDPPKTGT